MKKITGFILAALIAICVLSCCRAPTADTEATQIILEKQEQAVMIADKLYFNTYQKIHIPRCGVMDGEITSSKDEYSIPDENNQSNFGTGHQYQYVDGLHIDILMDEEWIRFCSRECKAYHGEDLCGHSLKDLPADFAGSQPCIRYEADVTAENIFTKEMCGISGEDSLLITEMLQNGPWEREGTSDCINNIQIIVNGTAVYYYHSDCGSFNDNKNQQCLHLNEDEKEKLNTVLSGYISLSSFS